MTENSLYDIPDEMILSARFEYGGVEASTTVFSPDRITEREREEIERKLTKNHLSEDEPTPQQFVEKAIEHSSLEEKETYVIADYDGATWDEMEIIPCGRCGDELPANIWFWSHYWGCYEANAIHFNGTFHISALTSEQVDTLVSDLVQKYRNDHLRPALVRLAQDESYDAIYEMTPGNELQDAWKEMQWLAWGINATN